MLEENKKNAVAFYKMAYEGNPRDAVEKFVGDKYIQHNPDVENGKYEFIDYFERMAKEYPEKSISLSASLQRMIWRITHTSDLAGKPRIRNHRFFQI